MTDQFMDTCPLEISDEDVFKAMRDMKGYLDITPGDFKEVYKSAYRHALERLSASVTAKEVMTRDVLAVKMDAALEEVAGVLNDRGISGVPVIRDDGTVAGVVSEKDFLLHLGAHKEKTFMGVVARCLKNKGCLAIYLRGQKAEDMMVSPAITVNEDTPISEIAKIFTEKKINRAPIVDQNNRLIGIVTRSDIVRSSCSTDIT